MSKAEIFSGICGFTTTVRINMEGSACKVSIESDCEAIQRLGASLRTVDPFREISFRGDGPLTLESAAEHCAHTACPVPVGIIKAVEVEAGLALPADVHIKISK
jgi:hypothetical protein